MQSSAKGTWRAQSALWPWFHGWVGSQKRMGATLGVGRKEIRHGQVCDAVSWTPVIPGQGRRQLC